MKAGLTGRLIIVLCLLLAGSSLGRARRLTVLEVGGRRLALIEVIDNRDEPAAAARLEERLIEAFTGGDPQDRLWSGEVAADPAPTDPEVPAIFFAPFLEPAAANGAGAVLGCFLQPDDAWTLMLVGVSGRVLEERFFTGAYAAVAPLIAAAAVRGFDEHFPPQNAVRHPTATLQVTCNTPGYGLRVDGEDLGPLPLEGLDLRLTAGEHRLVLLDPGDRPVESRLITLAENEVRTAFFYIDDGDGDGVDDVTVDEDDDGFNFFGCLFDALLSGLCSSGTDDDDDDADDGDDVWGPGGDADDDDGDDDDDDDKDEDGVWGPDGGDDDGATGLHDDRDTSAWGPGD